MRNAQSGLLHIPGSRDVIKRDVEGALFSGSQRQGWRAQNSTRFAQSHLTHLVGKLNGQVQGHNSFRTRVHEGATHDCDLLVQKVLRAAQ